MNLTGKNLISGQWVGDPNQNTFNAYFPATDSYGDVNFFNATEEQLNAAVQSAHFSFLTCRDMPALLRAKFLQDIAKNILEIGDELLEVTHAETGLSLVRLEGERQRTINQLNAFAEALLCPSEAAIEEFGDPNRKPLAKPSLALHWLPLGPVAVFGASNFPYAFSTLGGDTVSALAAGCPVVVKAHPAHPGTCEIMARAVQSAIEQNGMPKGTFSQLNSVAPALSHLLVKHPLIRAVGFTGSKKVADLLVESIQQRDELIPFYGELGSVNPQFILEEKFKNEDTQLATQLCDSLLLGNGQFCTSPGIWVVPDRNNGFLETCKNYFSEQNSDVLLTIGIRKEYEAVTSSFDLNDKIENIAKTRHLKSFHVPGKLYKTDAAYFVSNKVIRNEVFGPCAIIVTYKNVEELMQILDRLDGQLTASVYGSDADFESHRALVASLKYKVGRLIFNQLPTGVEISPAMNHGGPYPASTDIKATSVGLFAMKRFLRPLCMQNAQSH